MIKLSDLSAKEQDIIAGKICPYCNGSTLTKTSKEIYSRVIPILPNKTFIACVNYPACNSYVGTHDTGESLGRLAGPELRKAKKKAKEIFNRIWECGYMKRQLAYQALADHLGIDKDLCHFGYFKKETCEKAGTWALDYIVKHSPKPAPLGVSTVATVNLIKPKKKLWFIQKNETPNFTSHKWLEIPDATDQTFAELKSEGRHIIGAFPTKELAIIWTDFYNGKLNKNELNEQLQKLQK